MSRPRAPLCPLLTLTLALVLTGCKKDSSPTEPPTPTGGPTIAAASGARVPLAGTWRSRCFTAPPGSPVASLRETFVISEAAISIELSGFLSADCSGLSITEDSAVDYSLGAEGDALLAGRTVGVTRVDGTVRENGESFRQIFHVDDAGVHRLYHGELDGGPTDSDGYPTELFEESLERQ